MQVLLPLVTSLNILPFAVALSVDPHSAHYTAGFFGVLAGRLSGAWLQTLFVAGANLSQVRFEMSGYLVVPRTSKPS